MLEQDTNFAYNLRKLRKEMGINQNELGDRLGLSYMTVRRWEAGTRSPRIEDVKKICDVFNVTETELLHGPKEEDEWKLTIRMEATSMIDLTGKNCISALECSRNGAALQLGGSYALFENDDKFEDFINQLRSARDLVIETGRRMREIGKDVGE